MTLEEATVLARQIYGISDDVKVEISVRGSGGVFSFTLPKKTVVHGGVWSGKKVSGTPSFFAFWKEEWFKELCQSHGIEPEIYETGE